MKYTPDLKLRKAKELIINLPENEDNDLILYYIEHKDKLITAQQATLRKYNVFFNTLSSFLPNKNTIYK